MADIHRAGIPAAASRLCSAVLAVALLAVVATGHAGVQVLDQAAAARLAVLHTHGVPGEAEYVRAFGVPAPFVHAHCHAPVVAADVQPGPFEVLSAGALAGAVLCVPAISAPVAPAPMRHGEPAVASQPRAAVLIPPTEPPR